MTVIERRAHENLTLGAALPAEARSATCDGRTAAFHANQHFGGHLEPLLLCATDESQVGLCNGGSGAIIGVGASD